MARLTLFLVSMLYVCALLHCAATTPAQDSALKISVASPDQKNVPPNFQQVLQDPTKFTGQAVTWAGVVNDIAIGPEGTDLTIIEIPMDALGSEYPTKVSEGRFIATTVKPLDRSIYKIGMTIALDGVVSGIVTKPLGERDAYTYPVITAARIYYCTEDCADPIAHNCKQGAGWAGVNSWRCEDDQRSSNRGTEDLP